MVKKKFKISDEQLKQMYLNGASLSEIAKVAQDTKGLMALRNKLHELGVDTHKDMKRYKYKISKSSRIYTFNENIFRVVDSEEKAYWFGFLCADGYNHETKNCVALRIQKEDFHHLEKYKNFLNYEGPIYTFTRTTSVNKLVKEYCELNVCSPIYSEDLAKLGCIQNKTYKLEFPNIPDNLVKHFIRGYFDGDGCVSIRDRKNRRIRGTSMNVQLNIVGKESVILEMQNYIVKATNVTRTALRNKQGNFTKAISWGGANVVLKILHYLYDNATIYLDRKYEKYKQLMVSRQSNLQ